MPEVKCKKCGATEGFYRNVEITGTAWVPAEIVGHADGSISGETDDSWVEDKDTWIDWHTQWGCGDCLSETGQLEDLVEIADEEELDIIAAYQKYPIPGQEALDV